MAFYWSQALALLCNSHAVKLAYRYVTPVRWDGLYQINSDLNLRFVNNQKKALVRKCTHPWCMLTVSSHSCFICFLAVLIIAPGLRGGAAAPHTGHNATRLVPWCSRLSHSCPFAPNTCCPADATAPLAARKTGCRAGNLFSSPPCLFFFFFTF